MRKARKLLVNSPAIAVSVLALVFAVGGGAGYAASAGSQSGPAWHKLKVDKGWHGDLKYTVIDGVVYLTGSAGTSARHPGQMAKLPASLGPSQAAGLELAITFGPSGDGSLQVRPGGGLYPSAPAERFAAMYELNRARVYAFAVSKAGRQLADEILSEVFMIAWRKFDAMPDPPLPWLLVVARNVTMSQFRVTAREQSVADELRAWLPADGFTVPDIAEDVADRIAVLTALVQLPEADRELLTLVAWHGLTARSAAGVIGCSTAAFFVRLHRARRRLELAVAAAGADHDQARVRESAVAGRQVHRRQLQGQERVL